MREFKILALAAILILPILSILPAQAAQVTGNTLPHIDRTLPSLGPAGDGRRLWVELNCNLCHGANGGGQFGPNIQGAETGDLTEAVKQGIPEAGMPSYGKYVTTKDITKLHAYLASVGTKNEPKWWDWWVANPTQ